MKLRTKRLLLSIIVGAITYILLWLSTGISLWNLTPFWIFVLCGSFCIWIFISYVVLGMRKNESCLRKTEKWDSPKIFWLTPISIWIISTAFYLLKPYHWIFLYAAVITIAYISGVYMRNSYRKELKL
jgi:Kef-type K+ transport system membrane component KefB